MSHWLRASVAPLAVSAVFVVLLFRGEIFSNLPILILISVDRHSTLDTSLLAPRLRKQFDCNFCKQQQQQFFSDKFFLLFFTANNNSRKQPTKHE